MELYWPKDIGMLILVYLLHVCTKHLKSGEPEICPEGCVLAWPPFRGGWATCLMFRSFTSPSLASQRLPQSVKCGGTTPLFSFCEKWVFHCDSTVLRSPALEQRVCKGGCEPCIPGCRAIQSGHFPTLSQPRGQSMGGHPWPWCLPGRSISCLRFHYAAASAKCLGHEGKALGGHPNQV